MTYKREENTTPRIQSLQRALDILESMIEENEIGVTELGKKLGLPKGSVHRLLVTLEDRGYVQQNIETGKYRYGFKLLEIGGIAFSKLELRKAAAPILQDLVAKTNETVHLVVLDKDEVVYIDKLEGTETLRSHSRIGKRAPMHCTGVGKALMAYLSKEDLDLVIQKRGLIRYTDNTITDALALQDELEKIREVNYSLDNEEHEIGIWCVAVPLWDYSGKVIAAMSTTVPCLRLTEERKARLIELTLQAGRELSKRLGYRLSL
ncbi:hypothetical protein SY88_04515 [Clostridiales bacterium PH28_bin88]|nr:hypothetical protein SY88_04515 [Clostridiales bacterium PH28_bin88]